MGDYVQALEVANEVGRLLREKYPGESMIAHRLTATARSRSTVRPTARATWCSWRSFLGTESAQK